MNVLAFASRKGGAGKIDKNSPGQDELPDAAAQFE
jgi:hypothetical protein